MRKKRRILVVVFIIASILVALFYIHQLNKWNNLLNKNSEFFDIEITLQELKNAGENSLIKIGFSSQEIDLIVNSNFDGRKDPLVSLINPKGDYKPVLMRLKESSGVDYLSENNYLKIYYEDILCLTNDKSENYYFIFRLKYKVKKAFFCNKKALKIYNNISSKPYFSLITFTYINGEGDKIAKYISFNDSEYYNPEYFLPPNVVEFKTRIIHKDQIYLLNSIDIIDVRNSNYYKHAEYAIHNTFSSDIINRIYFPE